MNCIKLSVSYIEYSKHALVSLGHGRMGEFQFPQFDKNVIFSHI